MPLNSFTGCILFGLDVFGNDVSVTGHIDGWLVCKWWSYKLWMQENQQKVWQKGFQLDVLRKKNVFHPKCLNFSEELFLNSTRSQCLLCVFTVIRNLGNVSVPATENFTQQRFLLYPFYFPSSCLSLLLQSYSLHLSFSFFFSHTLRPGGWRGFGCTCRVAESLLKESMCFERSLESQASLCLSVSYSLSFSLLSARRLPAPLELMLCRTQHGLDSDRILSSYISLIETILLSCFDWFV